MSDNAMTTDTIKDMVRARYGDIAARAELLMLRAGRDDGLLRAGSCSRFECQGTGHRLFR